MKRILAVLPLLPVAWAIPPSHAVDLLDIHDAALAFDPQLQAAAYRRDAGHELHTQAIRGFLPTLSGTANRTFGNNRFLQPEFSGMAADGTSFSSPPIDTRSTSETEAYSVEIRQKIFRYEDIVALKQSRFQVSQADADYETAYQAFLLRVAERYFGVLTAEDSLRFAEAEEVALKRQFEQAEQRFEVGLTAVTDVHEARATYDNARANTIIARNDLDDAFEALREITSDFYTELDKLNENVPLDRPDPADAKEWVYLALTNNPELESIRQQRDVASQDIRIRRSAIYPQFDFVAEYDRFTDNAVEIRDNPGNIIGSSTRSVRDRQISLQLTWPIFQGGVVWSRTRQARLEFQAADKDLLAQEQLTIRNTENAYRAVIAGIREVEARRQALVSAKSALDATQAGFEVGTRTIVDVLLSEQSFFQAQRDYSTARHNFILDHLRLRQASGILKGADLVDVNRLLGSG